LSSSELIRAIQRIRGIAYNQSEVDDLIRKKKKRKSNSFINEKLDKLLYINDIISIEFDDSRHYKTIINKGGIWINGKKYIRLLCGAGMARRSTVIFANEEIIEDLKWFLNCGRNISYEISPSKFNAYYSLASTATWQVSTPNFCLIPDYEVERLVKVDFLHESDDKNKDPVVYPEEKSITFNLFDGQGLISPRQSRIWMNELNVNYTPAEFIFRSAYSKGLLATFDFHELAKQRGITQIKDVYGKEHWIEDVDVLVSASQFKLWQAYESAEDYNAKCKERNYSWGISRISPQQDKNHCFSTYQYIENLNITSEKQIENLCQKTLDWFKNVTGENWLYTILFLMGDIDKSRMNDLWFEHLDNPLLQVLLLDPNLINDKQIQAKIQRLINKKIRESYLGILLLNGNYQFMLSDPFMQAEWGLGLQPVGLLKDGQHYSAYWKEKGKSLVSAIRSPMTYFSENNILHLQNNDELSYWYKYLNTGIIFNAYGTDLMRMSGADLDGDACMTTDQDEFVKCSYGNVIPPSYDRKSAEKKRVEEDELWSYDIKTFNSRIGLYTNFGTEDFALLELFKKNSEEYNEVLNRLKICNCLQSMEIDRAKGIQTMDVPRYWTKWEKITGNETQEELRLKELHHKTICDKRPYFFRYLYPEYENRYQKRMELYNRYCKLWFDKTFNEIFLKEDRSEKEDKIIRKFMRFTELLDSDCVMNKICHYMENNIKELKISNKAKTYDFKKIVDKNISFKAKNKRVIDNLYLKYRQYKKDINYHNSSSGFKDMMAWLRNQADGIIDTSDEIVYWGSEYGSSFLLDVFPLDLINVLKEYFGYKIFVPAVSDNNYVEYMNSKYSIEKIDL